MLQPFIKFMDPKWPSSELQPKVDFYFIFVNSRGKKEKGVGHEVVEFVTTFI
jgi:hypothetical protein